MLYPIHVHKDHDSAYGASFPDFPGCFAGSDELQDLPSAAQEAVQAHFHGAAEAIPAPSAPEAWEGHENFEDGFRSEEHTSELQSLMRISYAASCLEKTNTQQ